MRPGLTSANDTPIRTYGTKTVDLCFEGQRFKWDFVTADISFPLLGADFLCAHGLLVDVKNSRLVDALTLARSHESAARHHSAGSPAHSHRVTSFNAFSVSFPT